MSSGRTTDGGRFSTIWIKTTNLCSSWGERYLHDRRSVCHKQGFRCIKRITLYATQPLVAQDRAGVEVIRLTPSRVCGESFLMIHALPHATAPVQYSSTVFDKKSIPTIRTPCNAYVEKCFTLVWNTSVLGGPGKVSHLKQAGSFATENGIWRQLCNCDCVK
jgi:hypothetical protein